MRHPFNGDYALTQGFGLNPANYAKFNLKGHNGLDYGLPSGTPVVSPHKGTIKEAAFDPLGYGWYIKIENDMEGSVLAHLTTGSLNVKVGDYVDEGQQLALSDNTGYSTGAHLHWGYYLFPRDRSNGYAGFIDQTPYLNVAPPSIPTTPNIDEDLIRGVKVLTDYRTIRELGPDGNFEGFARSLVDSEKHYIESLKNPPLPVKSPADLSAGELLQLLIKKLPGL